MRARLRSIIRKEFIQIIRNPRNLEQLTGVHRVGLSDDHLRVITEAVVKSGNLKDAGFSHSTVRQVEPDLEDVFLAIAKG